MTQTDPILATWSFSAKKAQSLLVMPDGCRDLILRRKSGGPRHFFVSNLMPEPERVSALQDEMFLGVRLKPGAMIDHGVLGKTPQPDSLTKLVELAREAASMPLDVFEMLSCLGLAASPASAAQTLGVSLRTLQRRTMKTTGRTPDFWRRLARARKAARSILSGAPLQEAAYGCRFSDQAHMTRELKSWFAMTPGELAAGRNDRRHAAWGVSHVGYDAP